MQHREGRQSAASHENNFGTDARCRPSPVDGPGVDCGSSDAMRGLSDQPAQKHPQTEQQPPGKGAARKRPHAID